MGYSEYPKYQLNVERHWSVEAVKVKAARASGITACTMQLKTPDGEVMHDAESLPRYKDVTNGSTLEMSGDKAEKQRSPEPEKAPQAPTANSVVTMAGMFDLEMAPGTHLSALQEADFIRSGACP